MADLSATARGFRLGDAARRYPSALIALALFFTFSAFAPYFFSVSNLQTTMTANSVILIAAVGMTIVLLTGGIDLSISTVISASAVGAGLVMASSGSVVLGAVTAVAIGAGFGLLNGVLIGIFGLTPFITTMGTQLVARGIAFVLSAGIAVKHTPAWMDDFGFALLWGVPAVMVVALVILVVCGFALSFTTWGRHVMLLGANRSSARYIGIHSGMIDVSVYTLSGILGGIAGFISIANLGNAIPGVGDTLLLIIIGAVVLGGTSMNGGEGSVARTLIGVTLLAILTSGLNLIGIPFYDQLIVQGVLIFVGTGLAMRFSTSRS